MSLKPPYLSQDRAQHPSASMSLTPESTTNFGILTGANDWRDNCRSNNNECALSIAVITSLYDEGSEESLTTTRFIAFRMTSVDVAPFISASGDASASAAVTIRVVAVPGGIRSIELNAKFWAAPTVYDPSALLSNIKVMSAGSQYAMVVVGVVVCEVVSEVVFVLVAVVEVVGEVVELEVIELVILVVMVVIGVDVADVVILLLGLVVGVKVKVLVSVVVGVVE